MTVAELIECLKQMPQDAPVSYAWDGAPRSDADHVWLSRSGEVIISDGDAIYEERDMPAGAAIQQGRCAWHFHEDYGDRLTPPATVA